MRTRSRLRAGASGPPIEPPRRTRKKCCYSQKSWGSIYCSFVQSPTHLSHITLLQPFRIKFERYIFLKNCVRSSLLCWLCFRMYMCIVGCDYATTKLHLIVRLMFWRDWSTPSLLSGRTHEVDLFRNYLYSIVRSAKQTS